MDLYRQQWVPAMGLLKKIGRDAGSSGSMRRARFYRGRTRLLHVLSAAGKWVFTRDEEEPSCCCVIRRPRLQIQCSASESRSAWRREAIGRSRSLIGWSPANGCEAATMAVDLGKMTPCFGALAAHQRSYTCS
ncbi:hypothetical protein ACLOJK_014901 [Asimina triloba]